MTTSQFINYAFLHAFNKIAEAIERDPTKKESGLEWLITTKLSTEDLYKVLDAASVFDPHTGQYSIDPRLIFDFVEGRALLVKPPTA